MNYLKLTKNNLIIGIFLITLQNSAMQKEQSAQEQLSYINREVPRITELEKNPDFFKFNYNFRLKKARLHLKSAIIKNELDVTQKLVHDFPELIKTDALLIAVEHGNLPITRMLVEAGADVNSRSLDNFTPLMIAAGDSDIDLTQYLLKSGASKDAHDSDGYTAYDHASHFVADKAKKDTLKHMLEPFSRRQVKPVPLRSRQNKSLSPKLLSVDN